MQAAARAHWQSALNDEGIPDPLDDFGFHYPWEYVRDTCQICVLSRFQAFPRAGGLDDQDPDWIEDLKTYLRGQNRARYEGNPDAFWKPMDDLLATPDPPSSNGAALNLPNWIENLR